MSRSWRASRSGGRTTTGQKARTAAPGPGHRVRGVRGELPVLPGGGGRGGPGPVQAEGAGGDLVDRVLLLLDRAAAKIKHI